MPLIAGGGILAAALLAAPVLAAPAGTAGTGTTPAGVPDAVMRTGTTSRPLILTAAQDQLPAFADCSALLDWYVAEALPQVGPYGWGWGMPYLRAASEVTALQAAPAAGATDAVGSSATGTNVQEDGVDEPDSAKTDGSAIVRLRGRHLVVTDVSGPAARQRSSIALPSGVYADRLLLVGDRVLVLGQQTDGVDGAGAIARWSGWPDTTLLTYDIGDPGAPVLVDRVTYEGGLIEARQYDDTVRLVLSSAMPRLNFVHPTKRRTPEQAERINKQLVRDSRVEDWLPSMQRDGRRTPLVGCSDVRHPVGDTGLGTLSIVTFRAPDPAAARATALTTDSTLAYSSADRLYVATGGWGRPRGIADTAGPATLDGSTRVYAFELGPDDATYAGSGVVPGRIADRWSLDEHDGYLRVATHLDGARGGSNRITVLGPAKGGVLPQVGSVGDLGPREQLQSVRWFDDLAVLVTFRQVDPLYTVDLSDPRRPRTLGELKIPGFSSYLHPIGAGQLLGLGTSATDDGAITGAQIATFDITDLTAPAQVGHLDVGRGAYLTASHDPHAFVYLPAPRTVLTTVTDRHGGSQVLVVQVAVDGTLTERAAYDADPDERMLPIDGDRVALVGQDIRLVDLA